MAFFEELSKKARDVAAVAADKAKDVADKAKDTAEITKINMSIAGEQREMDKVYRTIGEWFVNEYEGEIPDSVRDLVESVMALKAKIAELEASKAAKSAPEEAPAVVEEKKECPVCSAASAGKFCPQCGAPMGE